MKSSRCPILPADSDFRLWRAADGVKGGKPRRHRLPGTDMKYLVILVSLTISLPLRGAETRQMQARGWYYYNFMGGAIGSSYFRADFIKGAYGVGGSRSHMAGMGASLELIRLSGPSHGRGEATLFPIEILCMLPLGELRSGASCMFGNDMLFGNEWRYPIVLYASGSGSFLSTDIMDTSQAMAGTLGATIGADFNMLG
jgi:hypothetical protein